MIVNTQKLHQLLSEQNRSASSLRSVLAPATITRILRGEDVSERTITKLAGALGIAPHLLQGEIGVVVDRVKLNAKAAAQGFTDAEVITRAGVSTFERANIGAGRSITMGAAWRITDTLGVTLEDIL